MLDNTITRPTSVVGPLGEPLTLETLPPADLKRWVPRRKAEVVAAVSGGLITIAEACNRYGLSLEEFAGWQRAVERGGLAGLRATRAQANRDQWAQEQRREARSRQADHDWYGRNPASLRSPERAAPARASGMRVLTSPGQLPAAKRELTAV
jgi:transposase-like protein